MARESVVQRHPINDVGDVEGVGIEVDEAIDHALSHLARTKPQPRRVDEQRPSANAGRAGSLANAEGKEYPGRQGRGVP